MLINVTLIFTASAGWVTAATALALLLVAQTYGMAEAMTAVVVCSTALALAAHYALSIREN